MTTLTTHIGSVPTERKTPLWARLLRRLLALDLLARERGYMARLDDHTLADIGLSRDDLRRSLADPEAHLRSILERGGPARGGDQF